MKRTYPVFAQTTTTTIPGETIDPSRPITDFLIDLFGLDPEGSLASLISSVIEPLIQIAVILLVAWLVLRLARRLARRLLGRLKAGQSASAQDEYVASNRRGQRLDALGAVLDSTLGLVIWATALLTILGNTFGVNLAPFLAGAGIIGIAIGFGAQDLVRDFVAGVFMLVEDQYGVGDVIDVGDATGTVEKVSLRTTRLRDVTGTVWHFPNGGIRRVGNMSQEWSRALLDVNVAYGTDIGYAAEVIRSVAGVMAAEKPYDEIFLAPPEVWGVESIAPDAIAIRLVIKTLPGEQWAIARELRQRLKLALDEAGIEGK